MHISSFNGNYDVPLMYNPGLSHVKHLLTYLLTTKFVFGDKLHFFFLFGTFPTFERLTH